MPVSCDLATHVVYRWLQCTFMRFIWFVRFRVPLYRGLQWTLMRFMRFIWFEIGR
jgi:membrane-anchored protein YejM (alkaline phosphatase superfamily)